MQTILGANGIIGEELAKELHQNYTQDIRVVGRNPNKINSNDQLFKADLLLPVTAALFPMAIPFSLSIFIAVPMPTA